MSVLVLATGNPHKVEELRALLEGVRIVGLDEVAADPGAFGSRAHERPGWSGRWEEPVESGTTFEANARLKALAYAEQTGLACLADDSGLEIDALRLGDGTPRPGVISSHYCTEGREAGMERGERDARNNERVLREMRGVTNRRARFVCVMALAMPRNPGAAGAGVVLALVRGEFEGRIGLEGEVPRGSNGFGYDPLFLIGPRFDRTSAELSTREKNERCHRAAAAREMGARLKELGF